MQTAQNDAARLSSMVLRVNYFQNKLKNQDFEVQKMLKIHKKTVFGHEMARERSVSNEN